MSKSNSTHFAEKYQNSSINKGSPWRLELADKTSKKCQTIVGLKIFVNSTFRKNPSRSCLLFFNVVVVFNIILQNKTWQHVFKFDIWTLCVWMEFNNFIRFGWWVNHFSAICFLPFLKVLIYKVSKWSDFTKSPMIYF